MNKNIIKLLAVLVMCFMVVSVLVACGAKQGEQGEQGEQGAPGAAGPQGPQGIAGESAYIGSNGNWWVGTTDTGVRAEASDLRDCENHDYTIDDVTSSLYGEENKYVLNVHTKTSLGCTLWVCVDCGDSYLEWVDHNYVAGTPVAPTCTKEGYTIYTCSCGLEYKDDVVPALGHEVAAPFDKDNVDTTVWTLCPNITGLCDCVADPVYSATCIRCDYEYKEVGKAAGHVWGEYKPSKNTSELPDCQWVPVWIAHCTVCAELGEEHDNCLDAEERGTAPGHEYSSEVTKEPTCTENGVTTYTCIYEGCGHTYTEDIPSALGHNPGPAATCEEDQVCTECGTVLDAAHGHKIDTSNENNYAVVLPSESEEGSIKVYCVDCNKVVEEIVLPVLSTENGYTKTTTEDVLCADKDDIYTKEIVVDENNKITITVTVNGNYVHTDAPAKKDCQKVEGQDKWYYVYKCGNCGLWIVAYWTAK